MSHDAGDGHVQRFSDVHQRSALLEDGGYELVHQVAMRAAVAAGGHARWQRRTAKIRQGLFASLVLPVERPLLSPDAAHFTAVAGSVPANTHTRHASVTGVKQGDLGAERILVTV